MGLAVAVALLVPLMLAGVASAATGTIKGKVTALTGGAPIKGVEVCAYQVSGEEFEAFCRSTKADGTYALTLLPAGKYVVEFWPGSEGLNYITQYYDDKEFFEEADEITVSGGGTVENIDAQLEEGGEIKGTVTAPGPDPVEGRVLVCAQSGEEFGNCDVVGKDGEYTIVGLRTGEYVVQFIVAFGTNYLHQFYDHKVEFSEADHVPVVQGEATTGIDTELEVGAGVAGTVFTATGVPLPETEVCVFRALTEELAECEGTDNAGRYELVGLPEGLYKVAFSIEFSEIFGEPGFEPEDDGYPTQFYNGKPTFASADTLSLTPPIVQPGIDAHLVKPPGPVPPVATILPRPLRPKPQPGRRCRKGFKKRRVKGKARCVKVHKPKRHHANHRGRIPVRLPLPVR